MPRLLCWESPQASPRSMLFAKSLAMQFGMYMTFAQHTCKKCSYCTFKCVSLATNDSRAHYYAKMLWVCCVLGCSPMCTCCTPASHNGLQKHLSSLKLN